MLKIKRGQKGFTLIELLIVIAILGILAAIAIPAIASMRGAGNLVAANTEVANVQTAAIAYVSEHSPSEAFTSDAITDYLSGSIVGTYNFNADGDLIMTGDDAPSYGDFTWNETTKQFEK